MNVLRLGLAARKVALIIAWANDLIVLAGFTLLFYVDWRVGLGAFLIAWGKGGR